MKKTLVLVSAMLLPLSTAHAAQSSPKECRAKLTEEISRIDSRMRAGYGAVEGRRLQEHRKVLVDARAQCDHKPDGWRGLILRSLG